MSRYASYDDYDDYTIDDTSSTRTFYTQYTYPTDPVGGQPREQENGLADSVNGVCRAACDLLWWLAVENKNQQGNDTKNRRHRLRIVDSVGNESAYTNYTEQRRPVRWKSKGSPMPSLQSTYSSDESSTRLSHRPDVNWNGSNKVDDSSTSRNQVRTDSTPVEFDAAESVKTGMSSSMVSKVKDFHTIDSRVVQRRRQHKKSLQTQAEVDTVRFPKNNLQPSSYPTDQLEQNQASTSQPLGLPPLPPQYPRKESQRGILKSSRIGRREERPKTATIETQTSSDLSRSKAEEVEGKPPIHKAKAKRGPTSGRTKGHNEQAKRMPGDLLVQGQMHQNHIFHRRANSLDGMLPPNVDEDEEEFDQQLQRNDFFQPKQAGNSTRQQKLQTAPRYSTARSPFIAKHAASIEEIIGKDDCGKVESWEEARELPERSAFFERPHAESFREASLSSLEDSVSTASEVSSRGISSSEASQSSKSSPISRVASVLSAGSYSSARKTKEKWLRSRPSFENDCEFAPSSLQEPSSNVKTHKSCMVAVERSNSTQWSTGSVMSMDRKSWRPLIHARSEKEAMSVC